MPPQSRDEIIQLYIDLGKSPAEARALAKAHQMGGANADVDADTDTDTDTDTDADMDIDEQAAQRLLDEALAPIYTPETGQDDDEEFLGRLFTSPDPLGPDASLEGVALGAEPLTFDSATKRTEQMALAHETWQSIVDAAKAPGSETKTDAEIVAEARSTLNNRMMRGDTELPREVTDAWVDPGGLLDTDTDKMTRLLSRRVIPINNAPASDEDQRKSQAEIDGQYSVFGLFSPEQPAAGARLDPNDPYNVDAPGIISNDYATQKVEHPSAIRRLWGAVSADAGLPGALAGWPATTDAFAESPDLIAEALGEVGDMVNFKLGGLTKAEALERRDSWRQILEEGSLEEVNTILDELYDEHGDATEGTRASLLADLDRLVPIPDGTPVNQLTAAQRVLSDGTDSRFTVPSVIADLVVGTADSNLLAPAYLAGAQWLDPVGSVYGIPRENFQREQARLRAGNRREVIDAEAKRILAAATEEEVYNILAPHPLKDWPMSIRAKGYQELDPDRLWDAVQRLPDAQRQQVSPALSRALAAYSLLYVDPDTGKRTGRAADSEEVPASILAALGEIPFIDLPGSIQREMFDADQIRAGIAERTDARRYAGDLAQVGVETAFDELQRGYERRDDGLYRVENPFGTGMRLLSIGELLPKETAYTALHHIGLDDWAPDRDWKRTNLTGRIMGRMATGDVGLDIDFGDIARKHGITEGSNAYGAITLAGFAGDFLVPYEGITATPIRYGAKGIEGASFGLEAYRGLQFDEEGDLAALNAATTPTERRTQQAKSATRAAAAAVGSELRNDASYLTLGAIRGGDVVTAMQGVYEGLSAEQAARGRGALTGLPEQDVSHVVDVVSAITGQTRKEVASAIAQQSRLDRTTAAHHLDNLQRVMRGEVPGQKELHDSPAYQAYREQVMAAVDDTALSSAGARMALALQEIYANRAVAAGKYPTAAAWFEDQKFSSSPELGTEATLPDEAKAAVSEQSLAPTFYSAVERATESAFPKGAEQMKAQSLLRRIEKSQGVKKEEIEWLGLDTFLRERARDQGSKGRVTQAEVLDFIRANRVEIVEVSRTGDDTSYSGYTLGGNEQLRGRAQAGGGNYREVLLTLGGRGTVHSVEKIEQLIGALGPEAVVKMSENHGYLAQLTEQQLASIVGDELAVDLTQDMVNDLFGYSGKTPEQAVKTTAQRLHIEMRDHKEEFDEGDGRYAHDGNYSHNHFPDTDNVLVHLRLTDRTDAAGRKVLLVEEVQSDLHQDGRDSGYRQPLPDKEAGLAPLQQAVERAKQAEDRALARYLETYDETVDLPAFDQAYARHKEAQAALDAGRKQGVLALTAAQQANLERVPDTPFKKTWHELGLKRVLRMAAEEGYDTVAWTTGVQQAERYDVGAQVDAISWRPNDFDKPFGDGELLLYRNGDKVDIENDEFDSQETEFDALPAVIGQAQAGALREAIESSTYLGEGAIGRMVEDRLQELSDAEIIEQFEEAISPVDRYEVHRGGEVVFSAADEADAREGIDRYINDSYMLDQRVSEWERERGEAPDWETTEKILDEIRAEFDVGGPASDASVIANLEREGTDLDRWRVLDEHGDEDGIYASEDDARDHAREAVIEELDDKLSGGVLPDAYPSIEGDDLKANTAGFEAFYDQKLPSALKRLTRRTGARMGQIDLTGGLSNAEQQRVAKLEQAKSALLRERGTLNVAFNETMDMAEHARVNRELNEADQRIRGIDTELAALRGRKGGESFTVNAIAITPKLRDMVITKGQPLFQKRRGKKKAPTTAEQANLARWEQEQIPTAEGLGLPLTLTEPVKLTPRQRQSLKHTRISSSFNAKTAQANLGRLRRLVAQLRQHPPLRSATLWRSYAARATSASKNQRQLDGSSRTEIRVLKPPHKAIEYANDPSKVAEMIGRLTPEQLEGARAGIAGARRMRELYEGGVDPHVSAMVYAWAILSRNATSYNHEAGFIDAFRGGILPFVDQAVRGEWTDETTSAYLSWVELLLPSKSSPLDRVDTPANVVKANLNSFGTEFLDKMGRPLESGPHRGKSALVVLHEYLSAKDRIKMPNGTTAKGNPRYKSVPANGRNIRRAWWATIPHSVGINNKVLSFTLLVTGHTDVFVIDRIQARHLWDAAGRVDEYRVPNIYDGYPATDEQRRKGGQTRPWSSAVGLASAFNGIQGLALYEALEEGLRQPVREAYASLGREAEGDIGTFHWESWVIFGEQIVGHGSLDAIRSFAARDVDPLAGVEAKQGDMRTWEYGLAYKADADKPYAFHGPGGQIWDLSKAQRASFVNEIRLQSKRKTETPDKVVPYGLTPTKRPDPGKGWYDQPGVNHANLDALLGRLGAVRRQPGGARHAVRDEAADGAGPAGGDAAVAAVRPDGSAGGSLRPVRSGAEGALSEPVAALVAQGLSEHYAQRLQQLLDSDDAADRHAAAQILKGERPTKLRSPVERVSEMLTSTDSAVVEQATELLRAMPDLIEPAAAKLADRLRSQIVRFYGVTDVSDHTDTVPDTGYKEAPLVVRANEIQATAEHLKAVFSADMLAALPATDRQRLAGQLRDIVGKIQQRSKRSRVKNNGSDVVTARASKNHRWAVGDRVLTADRKPFRAAEHLIQLAARLEGAPYPKGKLEAQAVIDVLAQHSDVSARASHSKVVASPPDEEFKSWRLVGEARLRLAETYPWHDFGDGYRLIDLDKTVATPEEAARFARAPSSLSSPASPKETSSSPAIEEITAHAEANPDFDAWLTRHASAGGRLYRLPRLKALHEAQRFFRPPEGTSIEKTNAGRYEVVSAAGKPVHPPYGATFASRAEAELAATTAALRAGEIEGRSLHPDDTDDTVVGVLVAGMTLDEARAAVAGAPVEHAAVFVDGVMIARAEGSVEMVSLTREQKRRIRAASAAGKEVVITHNHPGHIGVTSLSTEDIVLAAELGAAVIEAVGDDGSYARITAPAGHWAEQRIAADPASMEPGEMMMALKLGTSIPQGVAVKKARQMRKAREALTGQQMTFAQKVRLFSPIQTQELNRGLKQFGVEIETGHTAGVRRDVRRGDRQSQRGLDRQGPAGARRADGAGREAGRDGAAASRVPRRTEGQRGVARRREEENPPLPRFVVPELGDVDPAKLAEVERRLAEMGERSSSSVAEAIEKQIGQPVAAVRMPNGSDGARSPWPPDNIKPQAFSLVSADVRDFAQRLGREAGVTLEMSGPIKGDASNAPIVVLNVIIVPKEERNQGIGSAVMDEVGKWADEQGVIIALTPGSDFGSTVSRLREFYRDHGFTENTRRAQDHRTRERMIRYPEDVLRSPLDADLRERLEEMLNSRDPNLVAQGLELYEMLDLDRAALVGLEPLRSMLRVVALQLAEERHGDREVKQRIASHIIDATGKLHKGFDPANVLKELVDFLWTQDNDDLSADQYHLRRIASVLLGTESTQKQIGAAFERLGARFDVDVFESDIGDGWFTVPVSQWAEEGRSESDFVAALKKEVPTAEVFADDSGISAYPSRGLKSAIRSAKATADADRARPLKPSKHTFDRFPGYRDGVIDRIPDDMAPRDAYGRELQPMDLSYPHSIGADGAARDRLTDLLLSGDLDSFVQGRELADYLLGPGGTVSLLVQHMQANPDAASKVGKMMGEIAIQAGGVVNIPDTLNTAEQAVGSLPEKAQGDYYDGLNKGFERLPNRGSRIDDNEGIVVAYDETHVLLLDEEGYSAITREEYAEAEQLVEGSLRSPINPSPPASLVPRDAYGRVTRSMDLSYPPGSGVDGAYDVVSLFDGISAGRQALDNAGIPVGRYMASEIDKFAKQVSAANWSDIEQLGDVTALSEADLPERFDFLIGGSPCQDLRKGREGLKGSKSRLFFEYERIFKLGRHKYFLFENNSEMSAADAAYITETFGVSPVMIDAQLVGGMRRKRYFWTNIPGIEQPADLGLTGADIMLGYDEAMALGPEQIGKITDKTRNTAEGSRKLGGKPRWQTGQDAIQVKSDDKLPTMTWRRGKGAPYDIVTQGDRWRRLARVEAERMMGFPDGYTDAVSRKQALHGTGNSWSVPVVEHIFSHLAQEKAPSSLAELTRAEKAEVISRQLDLFGVRHPAEQRIRAEKFRKKDYHIGPIDKVQAAALVEAEHYAGGMGSTYSHLTGLYREGDPSPAGAAVWMSPVGNGGKIAAELFATKNGEPVARNEVITLSRLVVAADEPRNAAGYLMQRSVREIRAKNQKRRKAGKRPFRVAVTFADPRQGHHGGVYQANGWIYAGESDADAAWVDDQGRQVSRKAYKTRSRKWMDEHYTRLPPMKKHRYVLPIDRGLEYVGPELDPPRPDAKSPILDSDDPSSTSLRSPDLDAEGDDPVALAAQMLTHRDPAVAAQGTELVLAMGPEFADEVHAQVFSQIFGLLSTTHRELFAHFDGRNQIAFHEKDIDNPVDLAWTATNYAITNLERLASSPALLGGLSTSRRQVAAAQARELAQELISLADDDAPQRITMGDAYEDVMGEVGADALDVASLLLQLAGRLEGVPPQHAPAVFLATVNHTANQMLGELSHLGAEEELYITNRIKVALAERFPYHTFHPASMRGLHRHIQAGSSPVREVFQTSLIPDADEVHRSLTKKTSSPTQTISSPKFNKRQIDGVEREATPDITAARSLTDDGADQIDGYYQRTAAGHLIHLFKTGTLGTLFHEQGHMTLRALMGKEEADKLLEVFKLRLEADPKVRERYDERNYKADEIPEEMLGDAFMLYLRFGTAPNGVWWSAFEKLKYRLVDAWTRGRGTAAWLPPEASAIWDTLLRPDAIADQRAMQITEHAGPVDIPMATVPDANDPRVSGWVDEARRKRAGSASFRRDEVMQQLGVKPGDKLPLNDLLSKTVGVVMAEKARRHFGTEHVRLTRRSIVPRGRVRQVTAAARHKMVTALAGTTPEQLADRRDGSAVALDAKEAAGIRGLAEETLNEPMGRIVPRRLVDPTADLSRVSFEELNLLQEAVLDTVAGVASGRDALVEKVPPSVGYAALRALRTTALDVLDQAAAGGRAIAREAGGKGLTGLAGSGAQAAGAAVGLVASLARGLESSLRRVFEFKEDLEDEIDPGLREILRAALADLQGIDEWLRLQHRAALRSQKGGEADFRQLLDGLASQLAPPVSMDNVLLLPQMETLLIGSDQGGRAGRDGAAAAISGRVAEGSHTSLAELLDRANLAKLRGLLGEGPGRSEAERAALRILSTYAEAGIEGLSEADHEAVGQALTVAYRGVRNRARLVEDRGADIAHALTGKRMSLSTLPAGERRKLYRAFYTGHWLRGDETRGLGGKTRRKPAGWQTLEAWAAEHGPISPLMFVELIARLRGREVLAGFSTDLARYGLRLDEHGTSADHLSAREEEGAAPVDEKKGDRALLAKRAGHLDRVSHYLNMEMEGVIGQQDDKGEVTRPYPAPNHNSHDYEAYTAARGILSRYGVKPQSKTSIKRWQPVTLPDGTEAILPDAIAQLLDQSLDRSVPLGRAGALDQTMRERAATERIRIGLEAAQERVAAAREAVRKAATPKARRAAQNRLVKAEQGLERAETRQPGDALSSEDLTAGLESLAWALTDSKPTEALKLGVTVGVGLPNPAYYVGNALGAWFQLQMGLGAFGSTRAMFRQPAMLVGVASRLWGDGYRDDSGRVVVGKDGRIYTSDMIADLARREGLDSSFVGAEITESLLKDIKRQHRASIEQLTERQERMHTRISKAISWQRGLIEAATAVDNVFRLAAFTDKLIEGESPSSAAAFARKVGYDYSRLTDPEKKYLRAVVFFYSFLKMNTAFLLDTFLTHPSRVMGQLRLLRGLTRRNIDDPEEEAILPDFLSRRALVFSRNTLPGRAMYAHAVNRARTAQWVTIVPPLPAPDGLGFLLDTGSALKGNKEGMAALLPQLHPAVQGLMVFGLDVDPFTGRELKAEVPAHVVKLDRNLTGGMLVDHVLGVDPLPNKYGQRAFTPDPDKTRAWWAFNAFGSFIPGVGRSMSTWQAMDRADLGVVEGMIWASSVWAEQVRGETGDPLGGAGYIDAANPRPGLTRFDEALGVLGVKTYGVPSRAQAREEAHRQQGSNLIDEQKHRKPRPRELQRYDNLIDEALGEIQ